MNGFAHTVYVVIASCLMSILIEAQTRSGEPSGTGSISGRVTSGGKPLAGLGVALQPIQSSGQPASRQSALRTQTDAEGRYQFTGVVAGNYQLLVISPLYVQTGDVRSALFGKQITLNDGENANEVNITLARGGVITGKLTDSDGKPLVEHIVQLDRLDARNNAFSTISTVSGMLQTDDRGVYRAIGLAPGRYRVSAGDGEGSMMRNFNRRTYSRTFHPDVQDARQATIIEIREGNEVAGVDIKLGLMPNVYTVSGRAIDADTGEPVANLVITSSNMTPDGRPSGYAGRTTSGGVGEFRIENVTNGRYGLIAGGDNGLGTNTSAYSEMLSVEVQGGDVSGVEIRVKRGGSISGIVVLEGTTDPAVLSRLAQQRVFAFVRNEAAGPGSTAAQTLKIEPDGRFRLDGLRPGKMTLNHGLEPTSSGINLIRIERDGVSQPNGIDVGPGEQITGIRVIFAFGKCIVRGQIVVTGGALPENVVFFVMSRRVDGPRQDVATRPTRADARGYFVLEGLTPGQYELQGMISFMGPPPPEWGRRPRSVKQTVEVANGQAAQVTMTLDLSRATPDRER
jgi:protocatechuate 3,4-dioxygenase beta subunit